MIWTEDTNGNNRCDMDEYRSETMMYSFGTDRFSGATTKTFTWQISCLNGYPELEYNMAAILLLTNAAGTIAASRSAMGEDNSGPTWAPQPALAASETHAYVWAEKMVEGYTSAEALAYAKLSIPSDGWDVAYPPGPDGLSWMGLGLHTKFVYNLYGDPTLAWEYEPGDHDPNWPWPDPDQEPDAGTVTDAGLTADAAPETPDAGQPLQCDRCEGGCGCRTVPPAKGIPLLLFALLLILACLRSHRA
jgi:hypothetical protein